MADINKFTTKEVLNKVLLDSSGNSVAANSHTSQEALNAVLDTSNNRLNVSLGGSNTISGDVTITGDLTVQGSGTNTYDEIVQGQLVVQTGSSGATVDSNADELVVESNGNAGISILTPNANTGQLVFGSDSDAYGAFVSWQGSANQMTIATANDGDSMVLQTANKVTALTIDSSQNANFASKIGIGVSPVGTLDINISTDARGSFTSSIGEIGSGVFALQVVNSAGSALKPMGIRAEDIRLVTGSAERIRIKDSGVGIGSSSPISNVEIKGTISALDGVPSGLVVHDSGTANSGLQLINNSGKFAIHADGSNDRVDFYLDDATTGNSFAGSDKLLTLKYGVGVGIGTDSPAELVEVEKDQNAHTVLQVDNNTAGTGASGGFKASSDGADLYVRSFSSSFTTSGRNIQDSVQLLSVGASGGFVIASNHATADMSFWTNDTKRLTIDGDTGNVGIGEDSPDELLHLKSSTDAKPVIKIEQSGNNVNGGGLIFLTSGTANDNDDSGVIRFKGMNDAGTPEEIEYATIYVNHDDVSDGSEDATMHFRTQSGGSLDSRLVIQGSNVGIGNTNPSVALDVTGQINASTNILAMSGLYSNELITRSGSTLAIKTSGGANIVKLDTDSRISLSNNGGTETTVFGQEALNSGIGGSDVRYSVAIGHRALMSEDSTDGATAVGYQALISQNQTGETGNTGIGYQSIYNNVTGTKNTAVGWKALKGTGSQSGSNITAIGSEALAVAYGQGNTALGQKSGVALTSGVRNVLIGVDAGATATTSSNMVLVGAFAGDSINNTGADGTVAIGRDSLTALTSAQRMTAVGYQALSSEDAGSYQTAVGYQALSQVNNDNGHNTALGQRAGYNLTTGNSNTIIGSGADASGSGGVNQIVIGQSATGQADNSVTLGNSSVSNFYLAPGNTSGQTINFNDAGAGGFIQYDHSDDQLKLAVADTINVRLYNGRLEPGSDDTQDLGSTTRAWHTLYVKDGINFPDDASANPSSDANTLDNYEEGDHNPTTVVGASGGDYTVDSTNDVLRYTKIGRLVNIQGLILITGDNSASGQLRISLPFTIGDGTGLSGRSYGSAYLTAHGSGSGGSTPIEGKVYAKLEEGNAFFTLVEVNDNGTDNDIGNADVDDAFNIGVNFSYTV